MKYELDPAKLYGDPLGFKRVGYPIRNASDVRHAAAQAGCFAGLLRYMEQALEFARTEMGHNSDEARCIEHLIRLLQEP